MITMLFLGALTLVRERERGSWESLLATPVAPAEALAGKLAPYMIIGFVQTVVLLGIIHWLFGVPLPPATWALLAATPLFVASYLVLGFAFSAVTATLKIGVRPLGKNCVSKAVPAAIGRPSARMGRTMFAAVASPCIGAGRECT